MTGSRIHRSPLLAPLPPHTPHPLRQNRCIPREECRAGPYIYCRPKQNHTPRRSFLYRKALPEDRFLPPYLLQLLQPLLQHADCLLPFARHPERCAAPSPFPLPLLSKKARDIRLSTRSAPQIPHRLPYLPCNRQAHHRSSPPALWERISV